MGRVRTLPCNPVLEKRMLRFASAHFLGHVETIFTVASVVGAGPAPGQNKTKDAYEGYQKC